MSPKFYDLDRTTGKRLSLETMRRPQRPTLLPYRIAALVLVFIYLVLNSGLSPFGSTYDHSYAGDEVSEDGEVTVSSQIHAEYHAPKHTHSCVTADTETIKEEDLALPSANFSTTAGYEVLPSDPYYPVNPYPTYNKPGWRQRWHGNHKPCKGPRGIMVNQNPKHMIRAYTVDDRIVLPVPVFGSHSQGDVGQSYCFDPEGRFAVYKDNNVEQEGKAGQHGTIKSVPSKQADWGTLQRQCAEGNADRFYDTESPSMAEGLRFRYPTNADFKATTSRKQRPPAPSSMPTKSYKKRSAVLLRSGDKMTWTPNIIHNIRAMITELSLHTGGEYSIFILTHLQDLDEPTMLSPSAYQAALENNVPAEFHNMTLLFNDRLLATWYPQIRDPGTMVHHLFAHLHPEFDFIWPIEMEVRYTGHWYSYLNNADEWAQRQPRKLMWERAQRFYMPSVHRSYQNFSARVEAETPGGGVWGPVPHKRVQPIGPEPPVTSPDEDDYEWGVGEDADVLAPMPILDATVDGCKDFPRRTLVAAPLIRVSRDLLLLMHEDQMRSDSDAGPELGPETYALLHGLKVAVWPTPVYNDAIEEFGRRKARERLEAEGRGGGGGELRRRAVGDERWVDEVESVFNAPLDQGSPFSSHRLPELDDLLHHNTYGWNMGGWQYGSELFAKWMEGRGYQKMEGKMCLPPMLVHPYKAPDKELA